MRQSIVVVLISHIMAIGIACAHEGHQPLPTKGVQVDLKTGQLALSADARSILDIRTQVVNQGSLASQLDVNAEVTIPWQQHVFVTTQLAGKLTAIHVRPGDMVQAGQLLVELDSTALHTYRLDYLTAVNEAELAGKLLETLRESSSVIAGQQIVEAELTYRQQRNAADVARARLLSLGVDVDKLTREPTGPITLPLRAPIGGRVLHADLAIGRFVEPTEHLVEIVDQQKVWVDLEIFERDIARIHQSACVELRFPNLTSGQQPMPITGVDLLLNRNTQQATAWLNVSNQQNPPELTPGARGRARLLSPPSSKRMIVPTAAVFSDGAERFVFVEESQTKKTSEYRRKTVVVGTTLAGSAELLAGDVFPGDRLVVQGGHELASLFFSGILKLTPETAKAIKLSVATAQPASIQTTVVVDGVVETPPGHRISVSPQVAGKIHRVLVNRNQQVKAGDPLAQLSSLELQDFQLKHLKNHLDLAVWQESLVRRRAAGAGVPKRLLIENEMMVQKLTMEQSLGEQRLRSLGMSNEQITALVTSKQVAESITLRAPIAGTIGRFERVVGQSIRADETLFDLVDGQKTWMIGAVRERDAGKVRVGQPVRIELVAYPGQILTGTLARIGPMLDASRTQSIWIDWTRPPDLPLNPNMLARLTVISDEKPTRLAIPATAVIRDGSRHYVFVQLASGAFERRRVTLGNGDDRMVEINSGLKRDESVAVGGLSQLQSAFAAIR